jgi:uncharacterized protein
MPKFFHVSAEELFLDSFRLGKKVYEAGVRPKHAISIWRGGTPVGLGVDNYFRAQGVFINHTTIATASYTGIDERKEEVTVRGLEHVIQAVCREDKLLIIDDVYESGNTIERIVNILREEARANCPTDIVVATVHKKPGKSRHTHNLIFLREIDPDMWIDYPHELADLVRDEDPDDTWIRDKDPELAKLLKQDYFEPVEEEIAGPYKLLTSRELMLDSVKLGLNIWNDRSFQPDLMLALWPGGVLSGLPIHEVFKYKTLKEKATNRHVDHVSINTSRSYMSYKTNIIGMRYLERAINRQDKILLIDSIYRSGRTVNDVIAKLKTELKRNITIENIRVASVYYNPDDTSTWTSNPVFTRPHYYLKKVQKEIVYPHNVARLTSPFDELGRLNSELRKIIYEPGS